MNRVILTWVFALIIVSVFGQGLRNDGATINVSAGAYFVLSGSAGNITLNSGVINLNGTLELKGSFINNSSSSSLFGTVGATSEIIFNGTDDQLIDGTTSYPFIFNDVTIISGAKVQVTAGKKMTTNGSFHNNGSFTLLANSTNDIATLKTDGSISGNGSCKIQAYLSTGRNWYLSSPIANVKTDLFSTVYTYNEPTGTSAPWTTVANNTSTSMDIAKGYVVNVPADGVVTLSGGMFNNAASSPTLTRTSGETKEGFNLIGNPYPAYYDFSATTKTDLMSTYWYRTVNGSGNYVFETYNQGNNVGTGLSGKTVSNLIPPLQAFWVRVNSGSTSGSFSFATANRAYVDDANNKFRAPAESIVKYARLQIANGANFDETIVAFNPNAFDSYDDYDSPKMSNTNALIPEIYTKAGNEVVAINGLGAFSGEKYVPLGLNVSKTNTYTLKATEILGFDSSLQLFVLDKTDNNALHELTAGQTFSFLSDSINTINRFEVIFKTSGSVTNVNKLSENQVDLIRKDNQHLSVNYLGSIDNYSNVSVYSVAGAVLASKKINNSQTNISLPYLPGVYVLRVTVPGNRVTEKIIVK